jgi:hypothetical protein
LGISCGDSLGRTIAIYSPGAWGYSPSWCKRPAFSHGRYCGPNLQADWW